LQKKKSNKNFSSAMGSWKGPLLSAKTAASQNFVQTSLSANGLGISNWPLRVDEPVETGGAQCWTEVGPLLAGWLLLGGRRYTGPFPKLRLLILSLHGGISSDGAVLGPGVWRSRRLGKNTLWN